MVREKIQSQLTAYIGYRLKQIEKEKGKVSSLRTDIGNIIGELTRRWGVNFSKQIKLQQVLKSLNRATQAQTKKKAKPIRAEDISKAGWRTATEVVAWLAFTSVQRMANLSAMTLVAWKKIEDKSKKGKVTYEVEVKLPNHKTVRHIGGARLKFNIPLKAQALQQRLKKVKTDHPLVTQDEVQTALKEFRKSGFGAHSFRRGGMQWLMDHNVAEDRIRQLTPHTTQKALLDYVDCTSLSHN